MPCVFDVNVDVEVVSEGEGEVEGKAEGDAEVDGEVDGEVGGEVDGEVGGEVDGEVAVGMERAAGVAPLLSWSAQAPTPITSTTAPVMVSNRFRRDRPGLVVVTGSGSGASETRSAVRRLACVGSAMCPTRAPLDSPGGGSLSH